jgi:hypothetical protein
VGLGRTLSHARSCLESGIPQCALHEGWILDIGAGYGHEWSALELRILALVEMTWWDEGSGYDRARESSGFAPALFTVSPGFALQAVWYPC